MKKILFLLHTLNGGGAEKVLVDLVNNLDKDEYRITVQTISDIGIYRSQLDDNIHYTSMVSMKSPLFQKIVSGLIAHYVPPKLVYKKFIKENYDYEVAFIEGAATKIISASSNNNAIKYAWVHTDLFNNFGSNNYYPNEAVHKTAYTKFNKIICVSQTVSDGFIKRFGIFSNLVVKYNVFDNVNIIDKSLACIDATKKNSFRIISVGRLSYEKGYDRLLEAIKNLKSDKFDIELWIIGEGPERPGLEKYISQHDLEKNVTLWGFQDNPYKYMVNADLFVCSSRAEGYSTVIAEALILQIPVVTTNCSGADELLDGGKYGIITQNTTDDIYQALKKLLLDEELYIDLKDKAKERSSFFKKEILLEDIIELF